MERLGMITIGQAPRKDVAPILERYLEGRAELVQVGVLDGFSKAHIEANLAPEPGDYVLTSRLATGESVVMSREKIQPILQRKIHELEERGIRQILLLCTGVFTGLKTNTAHLIEPDLILPPTVKAMAGGRASALLCLFRSRRTTCNRNTRNSDCIRCSGSLLLTRTMKKIFARRQWN